MNFILDANVIVKLFVREPLSDLARDIFAGGDTLRAPAHFLGEVGEVLLRRFRLGEIGPGQLNAALVGVPRAVVPISLGQLFRPAIVIATTAAISFYDALYVAAAEIRNAMLITADLRLLTAVNASPWSRRVVSLADWPLHEPPL